MNYLKRHLWLTKCRFVIHKTTRDEYMICNGIDVSIRLHTRAK